MRTPDYITFVKESGGGVYNPITGTYSEGTLSEVGYPCMVIPMSMSRQFDQYGTRNRRLVTVELNVRHDIDFDYALITSKLNNMNNEKYIKVEEIAPHTKSTIRLERWG